MRPQPETPEIGPRSEEPTVRNAGTMLLAVGFVLAAGGGWMDADTPVAAGANIGGGLALLVGTPLGVLGLALITGHGLRRRDTRRPERTKGTE